MNFETRMQTGMPQKIQTKNALDASGIKNPLKGMKAALTLAKHDTQKQAKIDTNLKENKEKQKIQQEKKDIFIATGLKLKPLKITTRKDLIKLNETTFLKIDELIEERASMASFPKPRRVVETKRLSHNTAEKRMVDDMTNIIKLKQQTQNKKIQQAAKITPQENMTAKENTIGLTQHATNMNAQAKLQGAQNHAKVIEIKYNQENQNG